MRIVDFSHKDSLSTIIVIVVCISQCMFFTLPHLFPTCPHVPLFSRSFQVLPDPSRSLGIFPKLMKSPRFLFREIPHSKLSLFLIFWSIVMSNPQRTSFENYLLKACSVIEAGSTEVVPFNSSEWSSEEKSLLLKYLDEFLASIW